MQIFARLPGGQTLALAAEPSDSVAQIKGRILGRTGIAVEQQRLMHGGRALCDASSLSEAGDLAGATLAVQLRLRGGCPPDNCCCCELSRGMRIWTIVFIVLTVLGIIMQVLQLASSQSGSEQLPPVGSTVQDSGPGQLAGGVILLFIFVVDLCILSYGLTGINRLSAPRVHVLWRGSLAVLCAYVGLAIATAATAARNAPAGSVAAADTPVEITVAGILVYLIVYVCLGLWYVRGGWSLARAIEDGTIAGPMTVPAEARPTRPRAQSPAMLAVRGGRHDRPGAKEDVESRA